MIVCICKVHWSGLSAIHVASVRSVRGSVLSHETKKLAGAFSYLHLVWFPIFESMCSCQALNGYSSQQHSLAGATTLRLVSRPLDLVAKLSAVPTNSAHTREEFTLHHSTFRHSSTCGILGIPVLLSFHFFRRRIATVCCTSKGRVDNIVVTCMRTAYGSQPKSSWHDLEMLQEGPGDKAIRGTVG